MEAHHVEGRFEGTPPAVRSHGHEDACIAANAQVQAGVACEAVGKSTNRSIWIARFDV